MPLILRITTVPISLHLVLTGQMRYMQEQGFDVLIVSADGPERAQVIKQEGCPHHIIPFTRAITPLQDLYCLFQLIWLMYKLQPDIVHTQTPKAGLLGMLAARITGKSLRIHTIAGLPFITTTSWRRKLLIGIEKLTYWAAQHVWPNSLMMLDYIKENKLCPDHKLAIIHKGSSNGINLNQFSPYSLEKDKLHLIKRTLNYNPSFTYLLAAGRIVKDKGIIELLEVFIQLYFDNSKTRLILVGSFENERKEELIKAKYRQIIKEHPGIQHITWSEDVKYYMHLVTMLIHASHREGLPNVLLQAGLMKCPIICSNIRGNMDIVEHNKTGLIFSVGQQNSLKKCIEKGLASPEKMEERASLLQKIVIKKFDRKIIQEALLNKYNELLKESISEFNHSY